MELVKSTPSPPRRQLRWLTPAGLPAAQAAWGANSALAGRLLSSCALCAVVGVPSSLQAEARRDASANGLSLLASLCYSGDESAAANDLLFYTDGTVSLLRDCRRLPLLLKAEDSLSEKERAQRSQVFEDVVALFPFTILVLNTFPFTPSVKRWIDGQAVPPMLKPLVAAPSAFSDARLARVQMARRRGVRS